MNGDTVVHRNTCEAGRMRATAEPLHIVQDAYDSELPRMAGVVAVIWQLTLLLQVLVYLRDFRQPLVPVAVWLGMLAAAAWLVPRVRAAGGLTGAEATAAVAIAAVAVLVVGLERRGHGATGSVDWSVVGTGWLLALVAVSRPAWEWILGAVAVFAIHAAVTVRVLGWQELGLSRLSVTAYTLCVILMAFAAIRPMFRAGARVAARRAELASRSAAERAAASAIGEDRRRRLAVLELQALPLLRAIADGSLDPAAPAVKEQCAQSAAMLRRALADTAGAPGELLTALEPILRAAGERGVPVETQVVGDPGDAGPQVIRATTAAVDQVLRALSPQPVTLTVLSTASEVELYLTFQRPWRSRPDAIDLRAAAPAAAQWHAAVDIDDMGAGCLEVRWPKAFPA
ncbi:MAG: hypothetical protein ACM3ML_25450 [Micromonosporaceae bacterium]